MRGSLFDVATIVLTLVAFSLSAVLGYYIFSQWETEYNRMNITTEVGNKTNSVIFTTYNIFDNFFVFVTFLLSVLTIALAFMVDSHPAFFIFSLIFLIFFTTLTAIFSNIYYEVVNAIGVGSMFPGFQLIWQNFPFISIFVSFFVILVMHAKPVGTGEFH